VKEKGLMNMQKVMATLQNTSGWSEEITTCQGILCRGINGCNNNIAEKSALRIIRHSNSRYKLILNKYQLIQ